MITSAADWRERALSWMGEGCIPTRPDLGTRYPWQQVALHAVGREMDRKIDKAQKVIRAALSMEGRTWRLGLSCGKDSTALTYLLAGEEYSNDLPAVRAMSVKDDLDYPGERAYALSLAAATGREIDILTPAVSLKGYLKDERVSLIEDTHSRAADLSARWFYGLIADYQRAEGYNGVFLGLRAGESHHRAMNRYKRGLIYDRAFDGLTVAQPLGDWTDIDVHAYLLRVGAPLLPVYLCIDPGVSDPFKLRKSWWIAGGGAATYLGHYAWLRRWWPEQHDIACDIDPEVRRYG